MYLIMAEVKKYSLIEELRKSDAELYGSPSLLGMTMLSYPSYINAMRSTMFTSHLKQFLDLMEPQFPYVFTNNENTVGKYSDGYLKTKSNLVVYKKIIKYEELTDKPRVFLMFVYDKDNDSYDVIERKECENLTENFGYEYNNEEIESYEEGDKIKKDTVLFKSTSYDEDMNYGFGRNVTVAYTLDPYTSEDAAVASKSLCKDYTSIETEDIRIGLNDNQYLLNLYGDKNEYKPLPPIGSKISDILVVSRTKYSNQLLYDFKNSSLREIHESDDIYWIDKNSEIIDYTIFSNNENKYENSFYTQINELYEAQMEYYNSIIKTCEEIFATGKKYSQKIDYTYKRAVEFLDSDKKWRDGDNEFSNIKIVVSYKRHVPLAKGCKLTG